MSDPGIKTRRADLDWLRVIAFGLLIYFHTAVAFLPSGIPMIQNPEPSQVLQVLVGFLHQFRLALLFFISGVGVCFALRHRNKAEYMRDRAVRLLVPLVFGILVMVPPMVFLEKRFIGAFDGSFLDFYPALFTEGVYPDGHLSWHHYWFIAYLYLFCVLAWPISTYCKREPGRQRLERWTASLARGIGLYVAITPLAIIEILLRASFPGFRDLIHDWASFCQWFVIFLAGFLFAGAEPLLNRAQQLRGLSLGLAMATAALLFTQFWSAEHSGFTPVREGTVNVSTYLWFCVLSVANVWFWLLVCLGYAGRYLQRPSRLLNYLNAAVYPLFCLHLTVIVALDFVIIPLNWPMAAKYLAITTGTFVIILGFYELCLRRVAWLRPLVGLKP